MSSSTAQTTSVQRIPQQFRAVILDYGRVLCHSPYPDEIKRMADLLGLSEQQFWAAFEKYRPAYDEGCSYRDFWNNMARGTGVQLSAADMAQLVKWDVEMWIHFDQSMLDWMKVIQAAGYKTALLSNAPIEFAEYMRANVEWLKTFDVSIFSAEIRLIKPGPGIFRRCLQELGVEAQEALFIDDVAANVEGARAAGLAAVGFSSMAQLAGDLETLGFQPLPEFS